MLLDVGRGQVLQAGLGFPCFLWVMQAASKLARDKVRRDTVQEIVALPQQRLPLPCKLVQIAKRATQKRSACMHELQIAAASHEVLTGSSAAPDKSPAA